MPLVRPCRRSSSRQPRANGLVGDAAWSDLAYEFEIEPGVGAPVAPGYVFTCPLCRAEVLARTDRALHDGDVFSCAAVGPTTIVDIPSAELHAKYWPTTALRRELAGNEGFYDCSKAERLLGWKHAADTP